MEALSNIVETIKSRFGGLSFNQKVLFGAVVTASVVSVMVFSLWLQKDEMAVLFTNLSPEDAAGALEELTKQDVSTELTNGGTTILVPENMAHRLRVEMAARGIPSSGTVGFEIFDGKQYGLTEFLQNVNFKRALEGELTKSIESLQGIRSARVHLVLPKPSIFQKLASQPTASVVLQLGRGAQLGEIQINGIQSLVSGSVEGLSRDNVTVIDQHGKALSDSPSTDEVGRSETQLALRKEVESYLAQKAGSMLDGVLGAGKSIVRVDATLNHEKIDRERETFDPAGAVIRSEERQESNDPQTGGTEENSITNYEINRTVERIVQHAGGISNLSVAVFVDGHYEPDPESGEMIYQPLSDDQLGDLRRVVQTAVGLSAVRGDQIEIVNMQFQQTDGLVQTGLPLDWLGLVTQHGGRVVLVIMLFVLVLKLKNSLGQLMTTTAQPPTAPRQRDNETMSLDDLDHFSGIPEFNDTVIGEIQDYASENPDRVAEVIQSWILDIDLGKKSKSAAGD